MTRRWLVRPSAQSDLDAAVMWYEEQQSGLGLRFLDVIDQVLRRVRETPLQFPLIAADVRRALSPTFPYAVYFRATDDIVVILAVLHLRREPRKWRGQE